MFKLALLTAWTVVAVAASAGAAEFKITQKNLEFSHKEITIKAGDTIHFINADSVTHNVYSASETFQFDLKIQAPGKSSAVQFTQAGVFEIRCAIHPKMKLRVTVQ